MRPHVTHWTIAVCSLLLAASSAIAKSVMVDMQPFTGRAFDDSPLQGELGRVRVPERRDRPDGATIELAFVRYRTTHPTPGSPVFFLAGGPGGSGVDLAGGVATHPQIRLLEHADVIGIDQRGTGLSLPCLTATTITHKLPLDRPVDRASMITALGEAVTRTVAHWKERKVDLSAYTSNHSADDIDDVRRALGFDRIVTFGTSYGSHLSLAYLRRHSEHVARALMFKVEGPDSTWKLPSTVQLHLQRLHDQVADDAKLREHIPDLIGLVRNLLRQLDEHPVTVGAGDGTRVTVSALDLQVFVSRALASTDSLAALPATLVRFARGDWLPLVPTALDNRRLGINAMTLMMDCASGGSDARLEQIERERIDPHNILADAIMAPLFPAVCVFARSPDLGAEYRGPRTTAVPTLFVSGTLDVRTPPINVDDIRAGFSNHAHIVVENTGHDARELMSPEYRALVQAFLRGDKVESCTITLPRVTLEPAAEGG